MSCRESENRPIHLLGPMGGGGGTGTRTGGVSALSRQEAGRARAGARFFRRKNDKRCERFASAEKHCAIVPFRAARAPLDIDMFYYVIALPFVSLFRGSFRLGCFFSRGLLELALSALFLLQRSMARGGWGIIGRRREGRKLLN